MHMWSTQKMFMEFEFIIFIWPQDNTYNHYYISQADYSFYYYYYYFIVLGTFAYSREYRRLIYIYGEIEPNVLLFQDDKY